MSEVRKLRQSEVAAGQRRLRELAELAEYERLRDEQPNYQLPAIFAQRAGGGRHSVLP